MFLLFFCIMTGLSISEWAARKFLNEYFIHEAGYLECIDEKKLKLSASVDGNLPVWIQML